MKKLEHELPGSWFIAVKYIHKVEDAIYFKKEKKNLVLYTYTLCSMPLQNLWDLKLAMFSFLFV